MMQTAIAPGIGCLAMSSKTQPAEALRQGILACRDEHWRKGLDLLTRVAQEIEHKGNLPSLFYSYLGVAIARCEGRHKEGLELCRWAVQRGPGEAENYLNLARVSLINGRRRAAWEAIEKGLKLAPDYPRLRGLAAEVGIRRHAVVRFLARDNPINVLAGQLRHALATRKVQLSERRAERRRERLEDRAFAAQARQESGAAARSAGA